MLFALGAGRYPPATQPYRDFTLSRIEVTRAFLRPTDPGQRRASNEPKVPARAERVHDSPPTFARYLYTEVGRDHPSTAPTGSTNAGASAVPKTESPSASST